MCKECHEVKFIANGDKMFYSSFDELTNDLKNKYYGLTSGANYVRAKKGYVDFINKLNENGDKLISDYVNAKTKVRIHYNKCGHIHPEGEGITPNNYKKGYGCGICCGFIVVKGINDVTTIDPQCIKYFVNIEDAYTHTRCSKYKAEMKCPICGATKAMSVDNLIRQGFGCTNCGDGVSYPEKVMALLLDSLNIKFKKQLKFDEHKFLYDFYLIDYNIIIEVHGGQHYNIHRHSSWKSYEEEHENDLTKYDIAVLNGYEYNKNYFIIDAKESNIEWLRSNMSNSLFFQQFDLSNIDWKEFDKESQKSIKIEACLYWKEQKEINKDLTTVVMAEMFKVDKCTIRRWLTWGNESGLCTYNGEEEREVKEKRQSKFVHLIKPDGTKWYNEAMSQKKLSKLTGISSPIIAIRREDGKPLEYSNSAKYSPKYIGSYVVDADEWDSQHN